MMLRLQIECNWELADFIQVLQATESFYYKVLQYGVYSYSGRRFRHENLDQLYNVSRGITLPDGDRINYLNDKFLKESRKIHPESRLYISKIGYASPGGIDLIGIGKALEAVEKILGRMLDFYAGRNLRREKDQQAKLDTEFKRVKLKQEQEALLSLQIKNTRDFLILENEFPKEFDELLLPLAVRDQEKLASRIAENKLVGTQRIIDKDWK